MLLEQKDAYIIHLDWLYHSYNERLKKVEKYEKIKPTTKCRGYYLYEDIPNADKYFTELKNKELVSFVKNKLNLVGKT